MEATVFLRIRVFVVLLGVAATQADAARATSPTKEQCIASSERGQELRSAARLHDAREQFATCVAASCPGPIREDCALRLDEVTKAMPSVVFETKDSGGNDVAGVSILMDGQPVAGSPAGIAIELDPGEHTFVFEAAGLTKVEKKLVAIEGVKQRRETVRMGNAQPPQPATSASPSRDKGPARTAGPPILAWAAFGVAGAGLAVGVIAGLVAGSKHATLQGECNNAAGTCPPQYSGDLDAFHAWRTVSAVGYIVAALGAAGGAVLWFTAPKASSTTTAHVWLGPASAGVAGAF